MEHAGALYYERGVRYFEIGEYELAVMDWIRAYESGYEQELTVKNLYQCFITPNEEEFRKNFEQNSEGLTELSYDACELDFIPVSEEKFYIYNRASGVFHGSIQLEQHPVHGKMKHLAIFYIRIYGIFGKYFRIYRNITVTLCTCYLSIWNQHLFLFLNFPGSGSCIFQISSISGMTRSCRHFLRNMRNFICPSSL